MPFRTIKLCICLFLACCLMMPAILQAQEAQDGTVWLADNQKTETEKPGKSKKTEKPGKSKNTGKSAKKSDKQSQSLPLEEYVKRIVEAVHQQQYASALVNCEQAMQKMDETTQYYILSVCFDLYEKNGKTAEALALSEKIKPLIKNPKEKEALCFSEATLLTKLNRCSEARAKYAECPGKSDEERGVIESNIAELYMIEGDCETAVATYQQAIAHSPDNPHAYFGMASALARLGRWDEAHQTFMAGVEIDPGFKYKKNAFFVPECENDYQEAYRMYELGRWDEASFYLERYIDAETRQPYQKMAREMLARIKSSAAPMIASYPVLLDNVRAIAQNDKGNLVAFSAIVRETVEDFKTQIWTLDTASDRAEMRLELKGEVITDMAFLPESKTLRMLGPKRRYEMDFDHPENGYYIYDNPSHIFALNLMNNGGDVIGINVSGKILAFPWNNAMLDVALVEVPLETKRLSLSADHNTMVLATTLKTLLVDIAGDRIVKEFSILFDAKAIAAHPNKKIFAIGIQSGVLIVDEDGSIRTLYGSQDGRHAVALSFTSNGDQLAILTEYQLDILNEYQLEIWNTRSIK